MGREVGDSTGNPAGKRAWRVKLGNVTELKTIFVLRYVVYYSQLHGGETGHSSRWSTHLDFFQ